jgi:hypothetical protein
METLPEPKTTCSKLDFEDLNLTMREFKGYSFEIEVQNLLSNLGYAFEANPVSEHAWKHFNIHHKVDVVLANGLRIECKAIDGKVYLSWFKRDWLPKGNCVFVFKGDLKLSPAIIEQYHPILVHYSLLPIYLRYKHPLLCTVTSFLEAIVSKNIKDVAKNVETKKYLVKTLRLNSSSKKISSETMELSTPEKRLHEGSIEIEAPSKGAPIPSSSLQVKTWKLEVGDSTHAEISESFSISITTQRGEYHEL